MRRIRLVSGIVICAAAMIGSLSQVAPVSAEGIAIVEQDVEYSFAQQLTFTLAVTSNTEISEIYLFFRGSTDPDTEKVAVTVEGRGGMTRVSYTRDVGLYPLPPFDRITYWWQIEDEVGNRLHTEPEEFTYADNRFRWRELSAPGISVHWIESRGDPAYAQTALDIAQASVTEINAELRAPVPDSLDIFLYDSEFHLEGAMVLGGRDWIGGQARPELGVVVVAVGPEQGYVSRMKRYVPHEITHLLVYELVGSEGYRYVPTWLDEGLATSNEQLPTPEYALALEEARQANELLSLQDLCVPFPPDPSRAFLSYAQSASVVRFIRQQYGGDAIRRLLAAYADGASCTSGVEDALGISFSRLESDWLADLSPTTGWQVWMDRGGVWIGLWLLSILVAVPMIGHLQREAGR